MSCECHRHELREAFDGDRPLNEATSRHVANCEYCQAYRTRLENLAELLQTPAELNDSGELAARVRYRLADEGRAAAPWPRVAAMVAAAACVLALIGWQMPIPSVPAMAMSDLDTVFAVSWQEAIQAAVSPQAWAGALREWQETADHGLAQLRTSASSLPFSPTVLYAVLAGAFLLLVVFNGVEARSLRPAGSAPRRMNG